MEQQDVIGFSVTTVTCTVMEVRHPVRTTTITVSMVVMSVAPMLTVSVTAVTGAVLTTVRELTDITVIPAPIAMVVLRLVPAPPAISVRVAGHV